MNYITVKGTTKGTIIFIHGNSSSSKVFKETLDNDSITQTKIALDLPGHGTSINGYTKDEDFSIRSYKRVISKLVNDIDDEILLVGNSLGGHIAIEIAPDIKRLKGLLIFGTPPLKEPLNIEEAFLPIPALQTFFTETPLDEEIVASVTVALYEKKHVSLIVDDFKASSPKVRKAMVGDISEGNFTNQHTIFLNLSVPKFIIAGVNDPSVNLNYLNQIIEESGANSKLIMFNDCGHYPSLEKPREFNEALKNIAKQVFK